MIDPITLLRAQEAGLPAAESHPDPPLVAFPLRVDWEIATGWKPPVAPYPAPTLTSRMPPVDAAPAPLESLRAYAAAAGWRVGIPRQSIGHEPHATHGRPGEAPKVFWSCRFQRGPREAVVVRAGSAWSSLWTWSSTQFFRRHATLEAFKEALR